ncbi:MAG TPA: hypothetical protein DEH78_11295, partial [Solibacterales bacterium]|nr:hypothetical protein [Bryobacterales bacterium]
LFGWPHPWSMKRTGSGLWFEMSRPGRSYRITAENGRAVVEERNTGLASALRFLHGSGEGVPNAPWTRTWAVYTEITNWIVLFAIGSGVYLWFSRARRRAAVMLAGGLGVAVSVAMMIAVWWAA